jgi:hypothetical protein
MAQSYITHRAAQTYYSQMWISLARPPQISETANKFFKFFNQMVKNHLFKQPVRPDLSAPKI